MGDDLPDYELGINVLKQALASLTAVVSATSLDIRTLNSTDKANIGIPYNTTTLKDSEDDQLNTAIKTFSFTASDWGAGLNWVTYAVSCILGTPSTDFMTKKEEGFRLSLYNDDDDVSIINTYNARKNRPVLSDGAYYLARTIIISNGFFSSSTQTLKFGVRNHTGQTVNTYIYLMGVAL